MRVSATGVFDLAGQNVVLELLLNKMFLIQKCTQANSKLREAGCRSTEMVSSSLAVAVLRECNICIYFLTMGKDKISKSWWQRMVVTIYVMLYYFICTCPWDLEPRGFRCWPGLPKATEVPVTCYFSASHTCPYQYGYILHAGCGIARGRSAESRIILWCTNLAVAFLISLAAIRVRGDMA